MAKLNLEELKMGVLVNMVNHLGGNATAKTFSQRSKAIDRLRKLADAQGLKLAEVFDAEGAVRPPKAPEPEPKADPKPAKAKGEKVKGEKAKEAKPPKGPSIRSIAEGLLLEVIGLDENQRKVGHSYEAILSKIKEQFPEAKTSIACLRWYAVHMRERNVMPPNRPRAVPAKAEAEAPAEA
jgi:hypothetical protein